VCSNRRPGADAAAPPRAASTILCAATSPEALDRAAPPDDPARDMTPDEFIAKWRASALTERAAAQSHFIDLCRLLDEPTPAEADSDGRAYEKGATKTAGGRGWADVWKRGHFAWNTSAAAATCAPPSTS
jgi:hypothetical protein